MPGENSPFQTEDAVQNAAPSVSTLQDKDAPEDVEVKLIFRDRTHHSGLEERCPLPLQGPLTPPVRLRTEGDKGRMTSVAFKP